MVNIKYMEFVEDSLKPHQLLIFWIVVGCSVLTVTELPQNETTSKLYWLNMKVWNTCSAFFIFSFKLKNGFKLFPECTRNPISLSIWLNFLLISSCFKYEWFGNVSGNAHSWKARCCWALNKSTFFPHCLCFEVFFFVQWNTSSIRKCSNASKVDSWSALLWIRWIKLWNDFLLVF